MCHINLSMLGHNTFKIQFVNIVITRLAIVSPEYFDQLSDTSCTITLTVTTHTLGYLVA